QGFSRTLRRGAPVDSSAAGGRGRLPAGLDGNQPPPARPQSGAVWGLRRQSGRRPGDTRQAARGRALPAFGGRLPGGVSRAARLAEPLSAAPSGGSGALAATAGGTALVPCSPAL